ncbi:MAG: hypothetical protein HZB37_12120 [Planctomycetes bacterium]|nr:hypothetical protein [Planctomycetota bacterium]
MPPPNSNFSTNPASGGINIEFCAARYNGDSNPSYYDDIISNDGSKYKEI